jgi:hypothetical protein
MPTSCFYESLTQLLIYVTEPVEFDGYSQRPQCTMILLCLLFFAFHRFEFTSKNGVIEPRPQALRKAVGSDGQDEHACDPQNDGRLDLKQSGQR